MKKYRRQDKSDEVGSHLKIRITHAVSENDGHKIGIAICNAGTIFNPEISRLRNVNPGIDSGIKN